ncbi:putative vesicular integral-membrane protein VIP36 [Apostichopus japonicus]|uniref:Putative vesicular integral-membrane protein VIP36 n=1 Tax=Stichopus japonicus TaxID=307972 RepID=A0A2G8L352_STIJA|nr:putative vesicular integral-membrane protein VIP36 [Apostichopus japonicus]
MAAYRSGTQCLFLFAVITLVSGSDEKSKNPRDYLKKEHSLMRPYTGAGASLPMWDIQGNTMVTNSYIRLTPDKQSRQGAIWNKVANRCPHWEMHVHFKVHGQGRTLFGDGFALWYTKERMKKVKLVLLYIYATLRKHIVALYDVQRIKLADQIQNLALLSLSMDHWTSAVNDAYFGITYLNMKTLSVEN